MQVLEIIKFVWPLIILQLAVQVYAIYDLAKRGKTKNLNFAIWLIIIILGEILGSIVYLLVGRAEEE
ncbi:TPA: hypothetical protein DD449_01200 [Candidatus Berkelbacteria bacterium]|uniref:Cardiolipin synthase N-terminal domain-containing protein n=1 Tax=Berkelbacteria bacterium GW2011_GWE1_39_12 TaxID=1618337 RepID=A0A0G4B428_9BACT|nr:MAG: hypothetical protein UT28_C0001G0847 [Berkelbacteria bacterium GW2011_GWE1_39_12]HBO60289.1 hypothetical protein [Candidatus Berkelbacteria bacterium]